jgi:hypothetical protein
MKASPLLALASAVLLVAGCKKQTSLSAGRNYNGANPATEGSLLMRQVVHYASGNDSLEIDYQYDAALRITTQAFSGLPNAPAYTYQYHRDDQERIIQTVIIQGDGSGELNVHYTDATSGKVAYALRLDETTTGTYSDSESYAYNAQGYVQKIAVWAASTGRSFPGSYDSFTYDAAGNLAQYLIYDSTGPGLYALNIGYRFQHDSAINPLFSYDDARLADEWIITSPNNVTQQTNTYGSPPVMPGNDVIQTWQYRSDKKPASCSIGGSAISLGSSPVQIATYYYQ